MFFVKCQKVNICSFAGCKVWVTTTQRCLVASQQPDSMETNGRGCVPIKPFTKQAAGSTCQPLAWGRKKCSPSYDWNVFKEGKRKLTFIKRLPVSGTLLIILKITSRGRP